MRPSLLERAIGLISPAAAMRRMAARQKFAEFSRSFDAADRGRRTKDWRLPSSTSANSETRGRLSVIRERCRDLDHNNPYASKAARSIVTNTVGAGIRPRLTDGPLKELWDEWSGTTDCDANESMSFPGLLRLAFRTIVVSGESLILKVTEQTRRGPNLRLMVAEPDLIDDSRLGQTDSEKEIQGVLFGPDGRRRAIRLYRRHPADQYGRLAGLESSEVPIERVIHAFRTDRAGQARGLPWLTPCVIRLRDADVFEDATLQRQKIASALVGFVRDIEVQPSATPVENALKSGEVQDFESGTFEYLQAGKTIEFSNPPGADGMVDYLRSIHRGIAVGAGLSYESLTADFSNVNFSSARMAWMEVENELTGWRATIVIDRILNPIWQWFIEMASLRGIPASQLPRRVKWIAPARLMIDPLKEQTALIEGVRGGLIPLSEAWLSQGRDPVDTAQQIKEDLDLLVTNGIGHILQCDPRTNTGAQNNGGNDNATNDDDEPVRKPARHASRNGRHQATQ